ncbi:hypothetical protein GSI_13359 [Ganoderma sinense ZZ0214-1]|uniref:Uncharacterized protein n=1 Tax=Ganoderma sinense ZZ0214-1 TaxID=1077348 RepID=A0A2G8RVE2_9APHY|nr:hypothetical protein GSI_13359 [Ganoderma sinense ZZ0214-1]
MTDQNDGFYSPPPNAFSGSDSPPYGQSMGSPPGPRRNRYTRGSMASWNSRDFQPMSTLSPGMMSPRATSSVGSRPLPLPSQSRATSEVQPPYSPPPEVDATPRPYMMSQPSDFADDRDWEPDPEEAMTIGQSDAYSFPDHSGQADEQMVQLDEDGGYVRQVIPLDDPDAAPVAMMGPDPMAKPTSRTKAFVGGFVASLRRLPKAVVKSSRYDRKATRKGAPGTVHSTGASHFVPAPPYNEPGVPVDPAHVSYVEARRTHVSQDIPTELDYAGEHSGLASRPHSARRASSQVQSPSIISTPRFLPEGAILADPELASDYVKMEPPSSPPDDSFSAHFTRVANFFQELKNLPWVSDRVAVDYRPMRSSRACVGKAKESGSWYNRKQDVDLLAGGPTSPLQPPTRMRTHSVPSSHMSMHSATATRTYHRQHHPDGTPLSYMTSPLSMPSPGASSHGHGQHPMSFSYYFAPPQPLYVYTPSMNSQLQTVAEGTPGPSPAMSQLPQALPVYMFPGPPPRVFQSPVPPSASASPTSVHRSHARPSPPTRTSGVPPSATQRSSHSRHSGSNAH